jgi:SHS family lactate transporter-like MFS transporter
LTLAATLVLVLLPFWATAASVTTLAATAFVMQFLVQCTFGVMPAHLNEISPPNARATFPGFTYQLGNMLAAGNATIQATLAVWLGGNYGLGLAIVVAIGTLAFVVLTMFGVEAKEADMHAAVSPAPVVS